MNSTSLTREQDDLSSNATEGNNITYAVRNHSQTWLYNAEYLHVDLIDSVVYIQTI